MTKSKNERKTDRKQDRQRRAVATEKRRQIRAAVTNGLAVGIDDAHAGVPRRLVTGEPACELPEREREGNPEIHQWWDRYMSAKGNGRTEMIIERLNEPLSDEWRESLFPEAVFEAESGADGDRYLALLALLAREHRELYHTGLLWYLRSRVQHLLAVGKESDIANVVSTDVVDMTETGDAMYGTVAILRLANLESEADELAAAGFRIMDNSNLMQWAVEEIFHWVLFKRVRQCIDAGASDDAIAAMEIELEQLDANMDAELVETRREMVLALAGKTHHAWQRNELVGTSHNALHKQSILGYEFAGWLQRSLNCTWSAADELRGLIMESIGRDQIAMRDYLDGVPRNLLDKHLASRLGFLALDRFKAPAMLIAVDHFVRFLAERDLVTPKSRDTTQKSVSALDLQLRHLLRNEWQSFRFLDPLRRE